MTPFSGIRLLLVSALLVSAGGCATDASTSEPGSEPSTNEPSTNEPGGEPSTNEPDAGPLVRVSLTLTTSDGVSIDAFALDGGGENAPGVLLLHQFQQSHAQWGAFAETLADAGYRVVAISYRGHGASDAYPRAIVELLNDPDGAPNDVDAGLAELLSRGADAQRIAIVGTSIGANLAVASAVNGKAKTYVSLSSRISPVEALAGQAAQGMQSVFYISSENDGGGQAADAATLLERTAAPSDILITPGGAHGIAILQGSDEVETRILTWLTDTL